MAKLTYALLGAFSALAFAAENAVAQIDPGLVRRQPAEAQATEPPAEAPRAPDQNSSLLEQLQNAPQVVVMTPPSPAAPEPPRYIVRATTLYANQETNDRSFSDEIYAVFSLQPPGGSKADSPGIHVRTSTFEDFDTGETKEFDATQNCLTSVVVTQDGWDCHARGDTGPLEFTVRLYEEDTWYDDFIGERRVEWAVWELAAAGLEVGGSSEESIRIGGYTLTWRVERVS